MASSTTSTDGLGTETMKLSIPTVLKSSSRVVTPFSTNILVVGGAYAGLSAVVSLKNHLQAMANATNVGRLFGSGSSKISITLIEPKSGLLNIIGIPRCVVDPEFAKSQYVAFDHLTDVKFDAVISADDTVRAVDDAPNAGAGFLLNYVQGRVTYLDTRKAQYTLNGAPEDKAIIDFDYVIYAAGRDRTWPITPDAFSLAGFVEEMDRARQTIAAHQTVSVIGAGAVGIELAGDIKFKFPHKTVNLIHPHPLFPPEPLLEDFRRQAQQSLQRAQVNVITNTRVARELDSGDLETTDGRTIASGVNFWCTSHRNNTTVLASALKKSFVTATNNVTVNEYLQLHNPATNEVVDNFFCLGDLIDKPIIKSAGWALYCGRLVANNLAHHLLENRFVETFADLNTIPRGMVIIAGNEEIVSELSGVVELNNANYVNEYKDYCMGKVRATLTC